MNRINVENSGKWSEPSTWPLGIFPNKDSEIFCNGHNIVVDVDVKVKLITNRQTYADVFGGSITINENITVTSDLESYYEPLLKNNVTGQITIIGNIKGSLNTSSTPCIINQNNGTINVQGIIRGGDAYNACGIVVENGVVNLVGELCYGTAHYSYPIQNINGTININESNIISNEGYYGENRCLSVEEIIV
jgi:hypothetical protein